MNPSIGIQTINAIANDAGAFPYQLDVIQHRVLFLRLTQAEIQGASFLDERLGVQGRNGFWLPTESLTDVAGAATRSPTPAYIFHIGHCGSTLLSRMLEQFGNVLALREPMVLRALASARSELESPLSRLSTKEWSDLLQAVAGLLGRPFSADQHILIKATSLCNNLIEPLLSMPGNPRAILLHVPLESYLATMLKGSGGGVDALHGAPGRLQTLHSRLDDDSLRLHQMDHAEILAMGWLAELSRFQEIESRFAASAQIMRSNFEDLLENPEQHTTAIARHLHLPPKHGGVLPWLDSQVMKTYSKTPDYAYSPADRDHDLSLSRRTFAAEIAQGMHWAERQIHRNPTLHALESYLR